MFKYLLAFSLIVLFLLTAGHDGFSQCENPTIDLFDANHPVDGNLNNAYCITFFFDPAIVGFPTGIQMNLTHTFQGDLSIAIAANGNILNVMQRPGAIGNCGGGCDCGDPSTIGGTYSFEDGGPDPEVGLAAGGGAYGVTTDDACGVGSPGINSFADLWSTYGPGDIVTAMICITDHAFADVGVAADITFLFPNPITCGCTDPSAVNFDPTASIDDGSCFYDCPDLGLSVAQDYFEFCAGSISFNLAGTASLAGNPDYEWTATNGGDAFIQNPFNPNTEINIPPDFDGTIIFTLTVIDEFGCEEFVEVEVNVGAPPEVEILGPDEICLGELAELTLVGGPFAEIYWPATNDDAETVFVDPGLHTVIVEDAFGCQNTATFVVDPFPPAAPLIFGPPEICAVNGEALLEPDDSYVSYQWSTGETTFDIIVTESGVYELTVEDVNGCFSETFYVLDEAPPVEVNIIGDMTICEGETALLEADFGFVNYEWDTGETTPDIYVSFSDIYTVIVEDDNGCFGEASFEVTVTPPPNPVITGPTELCPNAPSQLSITGSFASVDWSNGFTNTNIAQIVGPGDYSVDVFDAAGCPGTASIFIEEAIPEPVEILGVAEMCAGTSQPLTALGDFASFQWSTNETSPSIIITEAGNYSVIVIDADGCESFNSIEVALTPALTPTISGELQFCPDGSTVLSTELGYDTYLWTGGNSTTEQLMVNTAGDYSVIVMNDDGCQGEAIVSVEELLPPMPEILGDFILCENETSTLSLSQNYPSYLWSNSSDQPTIDVDQGATFSVVVTDANGCVGEDSVTLQDIVLSVAITGDRDFCEGESTTLSVPTTFSVYEWSTGENTAEINNAAAGNISVIVTDENGCTATDDIDLSIFPLPEVDITGRLTFCPDGATVLSATEGYAAYNWSNAANTPSIQVNQETNFSVIVTDDNGCQNEASVFVSEEPELAIEIIGDNGFCADQSSNLSVVGDFVSYTWSTNSNDPTITVTEGGSYSVIVTDEFGCTGTDEMTVSSYPLPEPAINGDLSFCVGESTLLNGGDYESYLWSIGGESTQTIEVATPQIIELTVTDINGCIGSTEEQLTELALPVHEIQGIPGFCPGENTILSGEPGFVAYEWNTNSNAISIMAGASQLYELWVTDDNGCVGAATIDVAEYMTTLPEIQGDNQFCPEGNTLLSISNTFESYNWTTGETTNTITTEEATTIGVRVTDENGCLTENSIELSLFDVTPPTIDAVDGFCTGTTATLTATTGYNSYTWSNNEQNETISIADGGLYSVAVIDVNGCASDAVISIEEYDLPQPEIGGSLTFCTGLSTTLNAGGIYAAYNWSTGETETDIVVNTPGLIGLVVTDENGCIGSTNELIEEATELSPVISGDRDFCAGESTELSAGNGFASYLWSNGSTAPSITVNAPGTYSVYVTDTGGCDGTSAIEVVENALPQPEITGIPAFCLGQETALSSSQVYAVYEWNTGAPTPMITVDEEGLYTLSVVDDNDCVNTIAINVEERPLPDYTIVGENEFCITSSTELSVEPAVYAAYQWSFGSDQQTVSVNNSGIVAVTVTDNFGCEASQNIQLSTVDLPLADAGSLQILDCEILAVALGGTTNPTGNYSYEWTGPGITPASASSLHPLVSEAGAYTLIVTNEDFDCPSLPVVVTVNDNSFTPEILLEVMDVLDCVTETVQVNAQNSDISSSFIYQWFDADLNPIENANTLVYQATTAQVYTFQIFDTATSCSNTRVIEVEEDIAYPAVAVGLPQLITCGTPTVLLDGTASEEGAQIRFSWTSPDGSFIGSSTTNILEVNAPGLYFLEVENLLNGCMSTDSVLVDENRVYPEAKTSDDFELNCLDPTTVLDGQGSSVGDIYAYQWILNQSPIEGGNQLQLEVNSPGLYTFRVINTENDCFSEHHVDISLNPEEPRSLSYVTDTPTCAGDADGGIIIAGIEGGTPPFLYSINSTIFGDLQLYENLTAGIYEVVVEDAIGCTLSTLITVEDGNDLGLELGDDQYLSEGEITDIIPQVMNVDFSQLVSIDWQTVAFLDCPGCLNQFDLKLDQSTQFFLSIKDENGCTAKDDVTIFIDKDRPIYVPNAFSPNGDGDNDVFYIFSGNDNVKINSFLVFNRWGESVFEVYNAWPNDPLLGWDGTYRGQAVNTAVYVWYAEVEFPNGDVELIKGDVIVMR